MSDHTVASTLPPHETLFSAHIPGLGAVTVDLELTAAVRLKMNRRCLSLTAGGGLWIRLDDCTEAVCIEHLDVDLETLRVEVSSRGDHLGVLPAELLSSALAWALPQLGWAWVGRGDCSLLDELLNALPRDREGRRQLWSYRVMKLAAGVWLSAAAEVEVVFSSTEIALNCSPCLQVEVPGLEFNIRSLRYAFGAGEVAVELAAGGKRATRWLAASLLKGLSWTATRWLREHLPPAMRAADYDPVQDEQRRAHFMALIGGLKGEKKPASTSESSGALFAALLPAETSTRPLKATKATSLVQLPAGSMGMFAACIDDALRVERALNHVMISSEAGVYVELSGHAWLQTLKVHRVRVALDALTLSVETSPALGPFFDALAQRAFDVFARSHVQSMIERRLGLGGVSETDQQLVVAHHDFGGGVGALDVRMPPSGLLLIARSLEAFEVIASEGATISVSGLTFLPTLTLNKLRLSLQDGAVEIEGTPSLDAFGQRIVTQLVRHRVLPLLPAWLGFPRVALALDLDATRGTSPLALLDVNIPVLGPLEVRVSPDAEIRTELRAGAWEVSVESSVLLLAHELDLALNVTRVRHDFTTPRLDADCSASLGDYGRQFLMLLLELFGWPPLSKLVPLPNGETWVPFENDTLSVQLAPGAALAITRRADGIWIESAEGLTIVTAATLPLPRLSLHDVGLSLPSGALSLRTTPEVGPCVPEVLERALKALAPPAVAAVFERLGLPALDRRLAESEVPTEMVSATTLFSTVAPRLGEVTVQYDMAQPIGVELQERRVGLRFGEGVLLRCPSIAFAGRLRGASVNLVTWACELDLLPSVGALGEEVLSKALTRFVKPWVQRFLPSPGLRQPRGRVYLAEIAAGEGEKVFLSIPKGGRVELEMNTQYFRMDCEGGVSVHGASIEWLPVFSLTMLEYALGIGEISLDVEGIEDGNYVEEHDVSLLSERLIEYLFKAIVAPLVPEKLRVLGIVEFDEDEGDLEEIEEVEAVRLFALNVSEVLGEVIVGLDPDDQVSICVSHPEDPRDREATLTSTEGLILALPGLRFMTRLESLRYHLESGEVQVDGLGQFENAMIEALIARKVGGARTGGGQEGPAPLSAYLQGLDRDKKGRCMLFASKAVDVLIDPDAKFTLTFNLDGLRFDAEPPIFLDGASIVNYHLEGLEYGFEEACFKLDLKRDNVFAGLLAKGLQGTIEQKITQRFVGFLPEAMRRPGYSMLNDPDVAGSITEIIQNFSVGKGDKA